MAASETIAPFWLNPEQFPNSSVSDLVAQGVKKLSAVQRVSCSAGDPGSIPGSGRFPPPGKEMATHSSILAWKILWTEETGRLQSMGLQE